MDGSQFDSLTKSLAIGSPSRRVLLKTVLAVLLGAAGPGRRDASAAKCRPSSAVCRKGGDCCSGLCRPPDRTGRQWCGKMLGEPAISGSECGSGIVADGVCCDRNCTGQCEACNQSGAAGTCSPVRGGPMGGCLACAGSGPCAGTCAGSDRTACAYPGDSSTCAPSICDNTGDAVHSTCNGAGSCVASTTDCGLYVCTGGACATSCASDTECLGVAYCQGGVCTSDRVTGQSCDRRDQCQSGACVDGVCCTSSSCPECQNCAVGNGSCATDPARAALPCSTGTCENGVCTCPAGTRLCGAACISVTDCCTDTDCGASAICQTTVCNQTTHQCETANAATDARCAPDACYAGRGCVDGVCSTGLVIKPVSPCFEYICDPVNGWVKGAAKTCNSPGPCQSSVGATCVEENLTGCVYPSMCASCQACVNDTCEDDCPAGTLSCMPNGVCNTATGLCSYGDICPMCQQCDLSDRCVDRFPGTVVNGFTCCDGKASFTCGNGTGICPQPYGNGLQCCGTLIDDVCCEGSYPVYIDGECCPAGSVAFCSVAGFEGCCDHECICNLQGCFC